MSLNFVSLCLLLPLLILFYQNMKTYKKKFHKILAWKKNAWGTKMHWYRSARRGEILKKIVTTFYLCKLFDSVTKGEKKRAIFLQIKLQW